MEKCKELNSDIFKIKYYGQDFTEQINSVIKHIKKTKVLKGMYQDIEYSVEEKFIKIFIEGYIFSIIKFPIKLQIEGNPNDFYLYNYDFLFRDIGDLFNDYLIFFNNKEKPEKNPEDLYAKLKDHDEKIDEKEERILILKKKN